MIRSLYLFTILALAVFLGGCSLFKSPSPEINIYNTRIVMNEDNALLESKDDQGNPVLLTAPKKTRAVDGDRIEIQSKWPTDFSVAADFSETYRDDVPDREMLKGRNWTMKAGGGSQEAMLYGINQSDRASEVAISTANAAAAAATAGSTEIAKQFAEAATVIAGKSGDETTKDTVAAILEGLKGLSTNDNSAEETEEAESSEETETPVAETEEAEEVTEASEPTPASDPGGESQ